MHRKRQKQLKRKSFQAFRVEDPELYRPRPVWLDLEGRPYYKD